MTIDVVGRVAGALVLVDVLAVYLYSRASIGAYPPSHPWSAIALLVLSLGMMRRSSVLGWWNSSMPVPAIALGVLAAALWTAAALRGR